MISADKIAIGFITYGNSTSKYLPYFLNSLDGQTMRGFKVYALDNSESVENENLKILNDRPGVNFERLGSNVGFARGFNYLINKAKRAGAEYFLALNVDILLAPDMLEKLSASFEDGNIGAVQPKILRWDFAGDKKTNIIDSLGLRIDSMHRFFDDSQGKTDNGSQTKVEIFGFTGAAVMFKIRALEDTAYEGQYFDELMFMYKEDCDLSYRLRLAGWKIMLESKAFCHHDRTAAIVGKSLGDIIRNRKNKSRQVKEWSLVNQLILLCKYWHLPFSFKIKLQTRLYTYLMVAYAVVFESYLIKQIITSWRLRGEINKRRDSLKITVDIKEIEKWM